MLKIFRSVRVNRNESLLEILGAVAISRNYVSRRTLRKIIGVRKETNSYYAYSDIHKNTDFLEQKGFLRIAQTRGRKEKLYDVTIKGALASLFSSCIKFNELKESELFTRWSGKDWGPGYDQPFANVKDVMELTKFVETLYLNGGSLEDVNEELLRRSLRNPEEVLNLIHEGKITMNKKIDEDGKYVVTIPHIPASVATIPVVKADGSCQDISFLVTPDPITSKTFYDLITCDPSLQRRIEICFLTILQTLASDLVKKDQRGFVTSHYFPDSRTFILTATIPEKVVSLLSCPEKVVEVTKDSYNEIIRPFLQLPDFVQGGKANFFFTAFKYDPLRKDFFVLSKLEIKERACKVLEQIRNEP